MEHRHGLDAIDCKILTILQANGRITNVKLASEVGLSPPTVLERVRKLEERGIVERYVALVNETFVRTHYGDADPIGRRIRLGPPDHLLTGGSDAPPWYTNVGVLGDVRRRGAATAVLPEVYIPQAQDMDVAREFFIVVHTSGLGSDVTGALRQAVQRQRRGFLKPVRSDMNLVGPAPIVGVFAAFVQHPILKDGDVFGRFDSAPSHVIVPPLPIVKIADFRDHVLDTAAAAGLG